MNSKGAVSSLSFVPVRAAEPEGVLRMCVALNAEAKPDSGPLILLRSSLATRVYLGAVVDAADRVVEWLEIWVQTVAGLADSPATWREYLSNAQLDATWLEQSQRFLALYPDTYRHTGWEGTHPAPTFIDLGAKKAWCPMDSGSNTAFKLCTNDALLEKAGLPPYSRSLHRYWVAGGAEGGGLTWVAATPGAPNALAVGTSENVLPASRKMIPFNPEGGLMHARRFAPIGFEDYTDLLAGRAWHGLVNGNEWVKLAGGYGGLSDWDTLLLQRDHLFLGGRGRSRVLVETFHLRLHLIHQLVELTADTVARRQLPMLNLSAESFRVEMGPLAPGLPILWSARATLAVPGQALALALPLDDVRHYLPLASPVTTIYRPEFLGLPMRGSGRVRIRRVATDASDRVFVEGTLVTSERLRASAEDLVWIKLPLSFGVVDLYANLDSKEALAAGEYRFRTVPQAFSQQAARALRAAEGSVFDSTSFETIPMLSTPCDLFALGVLAVRALFVNGENSLGVALDEILSLARQMGLEAAEGSATDRVRGLAAADSRWLASLGPHRLTYDKLTPEAALSVIPEGLWWETVATVARFFPGNPPDSYCRDFSDYSHFALEKVFAAPLADLANLMLRSRGLLFSDAAANREIATVLDEIQF